ncbi:MerR family transcriptional regulator [Actinotalea sp. M2MS4P-6]|uniref:MerR family transcriptional regulator n=1 Tax=Actinotalea sp. M2MS4P-6 TaxID=2983762 RepID=UPI0021E4CF7D|nr:MerR family transcriptional regulator [Actinotalea sp. M2MS4P-6]MCV2393157.1 MerR family transcriptional regulator [Actinotalea sp. M2MS4P-6]
MDTAPDRLLTLGEFSHLTRISTRTLRHLDEQGVLPATRVDDWTGFRHYSADLLAVAVRIRELRAAGLADAELARAAPALDDPGTVRHLLDARREALVAEAERLSARLRLVEALLADPPWTRPRTPVTVRTAPARIDVSLRRTVPDYADEPRLWQRLHAALPTSGASLVEPRVRTTTFHDESYVDRDPDLEVGYAVTERFTETGELRCVSTPRRTVATAVVHGPDLTAALGDVGRWMTAEGFRMDEPPYLVHLVGPDAVDPAGRITELCVPVATAAPAPRP